MADDLSSDQVVFRPAKKRKVIRQRGSGADDVHDWDLSSSHGTSGAQVIEDEGSEPAGRPSRPLHRRPGIVPKAGVAFSSTPIAQRTQHDGVMSRSRDDVVSEFRSHPAMLSSGRFVTSTGQAAVKDDKHMTAYIDSKLAESHFKTTNTATELQQSSLGTPTAEGDPRELRIPSQPEGTKSRHHAVEEVEIDKSGQAVAKEEPSKHSRRREPKPRIGRDGKPLPPRRPRGYRSEDDKARDSLVERLLAENRVEGIYDAPDAANSADDKRRGQDLEADARMAENFEREFHANAEERRAKMKAGPASKTAEPISGPKLGGSKNARVAKK